MGNMSNNTTTDIPRERVALDRLVKAYTQKELMAWPKTYGGSPGDISDEIERDHHKKLGAEAEFSAALSNARRILAGN